MKELVGNCVVGGFDEEEIYILNPLAVEEQGFPHEEIDHVREVGFSTIR